MTEQGVRQWLKTLDMRTCEPEGGIKGGEKYLHPTDTVPAHRECGMQLLDPALDICIWHTSPRSKSRWMHWAISLLDEILKACEAYLWGCWRCCSFMVACDYTHKTLTTGGTQIKQRTVSKQTRDPWQYMKSVLNWNLEKSRTPMICFLIDRSFWY